MLLVSDIRLRENKKHCRSVHPICLEIKTKKHMDRLIGRMYKLPHERNYKVLTESDTHIIGKKILVKSPITCASKKGICECCYGPINYHTNYGLGIGAFAGAVITEPLSQRILSTKHLLTTTSEKIEFSENFSKFFSLNANEITLNMLDSDDDNYSLLIFKDNIITMSELNEGELNSFVTMFHVIDNNTGEIMEMNEKSMKEFYITPELKKLMKHPKGDPEIYEINFNDIEDESRLFLIEIENRELTRPLYDIMGLLDTREGRRKLGIETVNDLVQSMMDLMIESSIDIMSVHAEVLLTPLIRSIADVLERPDFTKYSALQDTQMLTVSGALEKHPSVLIGLSFQFLGRQLLSPLTFRKTGTSFVDPFFKEKL